MFAWVAKQLHARSVGILSYAFSASQQPCVAAVNGFTRFGVHIGYQDLNINFGADMSSDVVHLKAARVDLVLSCMDITGNVSLARSLQQYGLGSVHQFWLDGYDRNDLKSYPSLMNGVIFLTLSVPFEAPSVFPGHYPGMQAYLATMRRYAPGYAYDNIALLGYLNARLFVSGLERAGPDPTRAKLITAINSIRDFTGGGIIGPVDWTIAHSSLTSEYWQCFVRAQNGRFVPTFTQGSRVFVWFRANSDTPVAAPPGTPGIMR
jgi:branched-chain amino acid transport system substrate-binding protein